MSTDYGDLVKREAGWYELGPFDIVRWDERKRDGGEGRIWWTRIPDHLSNGRVVIDWSRTLREAVDTIRRGYLDRHLP